jgi:hypothetical protein
LGKQFCNTGPYQLAVYATFGFRWSESIELEFAKNERPPLFSVLNGLDNLGSMTRKLMSSSPLWTKFDEVKNMRVRESLLLLSLGCTLGLVGCTQETIKKAEDAAQNAAAQAGDAAQNAAAQAASTAQNSLNESMNEALNSVRGVEGGEELVTSIRDMVGSVASTLAGITDEKSATSAVPELNKFSDSLSKMSDTFAKLPGPAKAVLANVFETALGDMKPQIEKILAMPGVEAIVKPAIDSLLEKFGSFKAA